MLSLLAYIVIGFSYNFAFIIFNMKIMIYVINYIIYTLPVLCIPIIIIGLYMIKWFTINNSLYSKSIFIIIIIIVIF